jgi:hypothetical protein
LEHEANAEAEVLNTVWDLRGVQADMLRKQLTVAEYVLENMGNQCSCELTGFGHHTDTCVTTVSEEALKTIAELEC